MRKTKELERRKQRKMGRVKEGTMISERFFFIVEIENFSERVLFVEFAKANKHEEVKIR